MKAAEAAEAAAAGMEAATEEAAAEEEEAEGVTAATFPASSSRTLEPGPSSRTGTPSASPSRYRRIPPWRPPPACVDACELSCTLGTWMGCRGTPSRTPRPEVSAIRLAPAP